MSLSTRADADLRRCSSCLLLLSLPLPHTPLSSLLLQDFGLDLCWQGSQELRINAVAFLFCCWSSSSSSSVS